MILIIQGKKIKTLDVFFNDNFFIKKETIQLSTLKHSFNHI